MDLVPPAAWLGDGQRIFLRNARRLVEAAVFGVARRIDDLAVVLFGIRGLAKSGGRRFKISCGHDRSLRRRSRLLFRLSHLFHDLLLDRGAAAHLGKPSHHL